MPADPKQTRSLRQKAEARLSQEPGTRTMVSVIRDITERKRTEEALQESEERFRTLADAAFEGIAISEQGRVVDANDQLLRIIGCTRKQLIGHEVATLVIPEDRDRVMASIMRGVESRIEHRMVRQDGTPIIVETHGRTITRQGRQARITAIRDITEQKKTEEALRKSRGELELRVQERTGELYTAYEKLKQEMAEREQIERQLGQAQKLESLGTLSGGIAHDFNNILAAIIGFTELVAGHVEKGSRDERHLARVIEASVRGRELVHQMLTFARRTEQEKKPLQFSSIVRETVKLLRATTPSTIDMRVDIQSESGFILADPIQIQQVLMNLAVNGIHVMREKGGILDISLADHTVSPSDEGSPTITPGPYLKLTVSDTDSGIAPDLVDRIFDPFFTTKKPGEGTGLGLSVVHGIVRHSGGQITVQSEPGKGSAFTVYLPRISGTPETHALGDNEIPTGTERVLFVDDEEALVEMGEEILAELGYDVVTRTSSREALALFTADPTRFDVVITDQTMPEMTGVELAREILSIRPDIPIIMCTGFSQIVDEDKAAETGIKAFAMKPLTKKEIAESIRKVLEM